MSAAITLGVAAFAHTVRMENEQKKKEEAAAKAAGQPQVSSSEPWGPSVQHRTNLMDLAMSYLPGMGGNTSYASGGGGAAGGGGTNYNLASFEKAIMADPKMPAAGKEWILSFARRGEWNTVAQNLPKMQLSDQTRAAIGTLAGGSAPAARTGSGGGGRSGGGGGGTGSGGGGGMQGTYEDFIKRTLGGEFLSGNPHLDAAIDKATRGMDERYYANYANNDLSAELTGRLGGGAHQLGQARAFNDYNTAVGDIDAAMRFQGYDAERERQMQALGIGTGYDSSLKSIAAQRAATAASARAAANALNWQKQQFNTMLPYNQMGSVADIINAMSGAYGQNVNPGKTVVPPYRDPMQQGLQAGVAAYDIAKRWGQAGSTPTAPVATVPAGQTGGYFTGYTQPNWQIGG